MLQEGDTVLSVYNVSGEVTHVLSIYNALEEGDRCVKCSIAC